MKPKFSFILSLIFLCIASMANAQTYDKLWKEIEAAKKKSLPQTVTKLSEQLFRKAESERNTPQMLKAYMTRATYQTQITPDSFYVSLSGLEKWAASTDKPVERSILHTLIADVYAEYLSNNRWSLKQRTDIDGEAPEDIREWSANMFVEKIMENARAAMETPGTLLAASSKEYQPFIVQGETSGYYHHDLYHTLAGYNARALQSATSFNSESDSTVRKAIEKIYSDLLSTYKERNNEDGFILSTLDYLKWKNEGMESYSKELDKLIDKYSANELIVEAYILKANNLQNSNRQQESLELCNNVIAKYPKYKRINAMKEIKERVLEPALAVNTKGTVYPGKPVSLNISHRNLNTFTVSLYKINLPVTAKELNDYEALNKGLYEKSSRKVSTQEFRLTPPSDYRMKDTVLTITAPDEGLYYMQIVADANKKDIKNSLLSVTRMKSMSRKLPGNQFEVIVVDEQTGKPVKGAEVRFFDDKKGQKVETGTFTTGEDGRIETVWKDQYAWLTVKKDADASMLLQRTSRGYYTFTDGSRSSASVKLLTDRALYRPGQTVYVKGIAYDQKSDTAQVISGKSYTLTLTDGNNREVGKKELRTNDFGSFTAEFVLPSAGLNGTYYLQTENGRASIRVEEYKRPTFDITFDPQSGSYRFGDAIQVKGTVKTYSGIPVQELPVQYTVKRSLNYWWRGFYGEGTLVASGSSMLTDEGTFAIPVSLIPEAGYADTDYGFYSFTVEATVTNEAGETQSSTVSIPVGNRSLLLSVELPDRINKKEAIKTTFSATNLNGQPVGVEGTYAIYPFTDYAKRTVGDKPVYTGKFVSNKETTLTEWSSIPSGAYKVKLSAKDESGREAAFEKEMILFSIDDKRAPVEVDSWYHPVNTSFDKAHPASFVFGTSKKEAHVLMDVFSGNRRIESRVLQMSDELSTFNYPYKEEYGNGLTITFLFVKEGTVVQQNVKLAKRLPEKELKLSWEVFRDKLRPGQEEVWKLTVKTPQGVPADAELLATMYDASLDKIWKNNQQLRLNYNLPTPSVSLNTYGNGMNYYHFWFNRPVHKYPAMAYDSFWMNTSGLLYGHIDQLDEVIMIGYGSARKQSRSVFAKPKTKNGLFTDTVFEEEAAPLAMQADVLETGGATLEESSDVRTNFAETAFFYPQLRTNEQGEIVLAFTMPESLTRWNFSGYAHTKGMLTGMINGEVVTSKEFMLTPNLPRFVRVGDQTSVAASVANLTGKDTSGTVTFTLFDPMTEKVISTRKQKFSAAAGKTTAVSFMFTATDKYDMLGCRIVAEGGGFSDGEQHLLPVLSNKENITETISMPVRGKETREFSLESLFNNNSKTATNRKLTVEFTGNPAWYAVQALPSLSLPSNDNAVSWAAVYYANSLASYIINAQPRIKTTFDAWKQQGGTKETFMSNLQKNQDVKNILLEESPWLMEATSETEQMQRIATLFDLNNIRNNNITALTKLKDLQLTDGSWTWYKGMPGNRYMTTFVVKTLARLAALTGKPLDGDALSMSRSAFTFLHAQAVDEYNDIRKAEKQGNKAKGISASALEYLYLTAIAGEQIPSKSKEAYTYFLSKVSESITSLSLTQKAQAAVVLQNAKRTAEAKAFIASLKEHTAQTDEQGMHFAFNEDPYSWLGLKIPAHVAVMEAMDVVANDTKAVEEMKLWLLKQKQAQQWDSPVSTVNAVYALLHRGSNLLENRGDARISLGGKVMETLQAGKASVPGLAYVKETISDNATLAKAKKVIVEKKDEGIAWGAVYAQYREDIDKVSRHGGELSVDKKLYVEKVSGSTRQLIPITKDTRLAVGDKVTSRLTIRLDRAMDFVQLKDQRGACFEPIGALSVYIWNGGTGYYVAVKDASTNFFFHSLNKGVYVLEYSYRVSRKGTYEAGLAIIQSAYAPEYASHSASVKVKAE